MDMVHLLEKGHRASPRSTSKKGQTVTSLWDNTSTGTVTVIRRDAASRDRRQFLVGEFAGGVTAGQFFLERRLVLRRREGEAGRGRDADDGGDGRLHVVGFHPPHLLLQRLVGLRLLPERMDGF